MENLSRQLESLSLTSKEEKFYEYLAILGTLPHELKQAKFFEYFNKLNQIINGQTANILPTRDDNNETQYQIFERHSDAIMERTLSFAKHHQLEFFPISCLNYLNNIINIGSGIDGNQLKQISCANICVSDHFTCKNIGKMLCGNCRVIFYCSKECQKKHWKFHKVYCKSDIASKDWQPDYIKEMRMPSFMLPEISLFSSYPTQIEYLWSNMPAIDILNLSLNELKDGKASSDYKDSINLLFAASGDLNDIITTINGLPLDFNQQINIYINDFVERVTIRNFLMLYLLAKLGKNAIDIVIQIWYSSALTGEQWIKTIEILTTTVLQKIYSQIKEDYIFEFDKLKICTHFKPQTWKCFMKMINCKIDLQLAIDMRNKIMLSPMRKDYLHKHMHGLTPGERICYEYFRRNGILLPFGALNAHHNVPNIFILDPEHGWTIPDCSDPLSGWDLFKVIQVKNGTAKDDLYGKLFFYLREQLESFVERLQKLNIKFDLYDEDALELSQKLKMKRFDRIYVSNICDEIYSGIKPVLTKFRPLLNEKNPNSTLITLLMNWLPSIPDKFFKDTLSKKHYEKNTSSSLQQTFNSILTIANNTENEINASYIHTNEFKKYMEKMNVNTTAKKVGLCYRKIHKIVPKRLYGSMKKDDQDKALLIDDERKKHLLYDVTLNTLREHYVEWEIVA